MLQPSSIVLSACRTSGVIFQPRLTNTNPNPNKTPVQSSLVTGPNVPCHRSNRPLPPVQSSLVDIISTARRQQHQRHSTTVLTLLLTLLLVSQYRAAVIMACVTFPFFPIDSNSLRSVSLFYSLLMFALRNQPSHENLFLTPPPPPTLLPPTPPLIETSTRLRQDRTISTASCCFS